MKVDICPPSKMEVIRQIGLLKRYKMVAYPVGAECFTQWINVTGWLDRNVLMAGWLVWRISNVLSVIGNCGIEIGMKLRVHGHVSWLQYRVEYTNMPWLMSTKQLLVGWLNDHWRFEDDVFSRRISTPWHQFPVAFRIRMQVHNSDYLGAVSKSHWRTKQCLLSTWRYFLSQVHEIRVGLGNSCTPLKTRMSQE